MSDRRTVGNFTSLRAGTYGTYARIFSITSFYGSSCANNGKGALTTPVGTYTRICKIEERVGSAKNFVVVRVDLLSPRRSTRASEIGLVQVGGSGSWHGYLGAAPAAAPPPAAAAAPACGRRACTRPSAPARSATGPQPYTRTHVTNISLNVLLNNTSRTSSTKPYYLPTNSTISYSPKKMERSSEYYSVASVTTLFGLHKWRFVERALQRLLDAHNGSTKPVS
eukprot:1177727-Prorocentrum_minimum.AAC.1